MLWNTGAFDDVVVERKDSGAGSVLTFVVRERPLVTHVAIDGATAFPVSALHPLTRLREGNRSTSGMSSAAGTPCAMPTWSEATVR